jgi:hypothetical protein
MVAGSIPAGITGDLEFTRNSIYDGGHVSPYFESKQANKKHPVRHSATGCFFYFSLLIQVNFV